MYVYILLIMMQQSPHSETINWAEMVATCVCLNTRKASRAITQFYDRVLQPSGLRTSQFGLLGVIALAGEATMTHLAEEMVMDRTTLTRNLKPLESQGLITIVDGVDRRTRLVRVTDAGRQALMRARPLWQEAQAQVVSRLGGDQWRTLLADLSAVTRIGEAG